MPNHYHFMRLEVTISSKEEILEAIAQASLTQPLQVATLNPEFALEANHNSHFAAYLRTTPRCLLDGFGLYLMLSVWQKMIGQNPPPPTYRGADLIEDLFKMYQDGSKRFFFLGGGSERSIKETATAIQKRFPKLSIVGHERGGIIEKENVIIEPGLASRIIAASPDILLVGFGAPKQELWMEAFAKLHTIPVMGGVGGSFDFYSTKKRSPHWMRRLNLEWLYRGFTEKGHFKRLWRAVVIFSVSSVFWMIRHSGLIFQGRK